MFSSHMLRPSFRWVPEGTRIIPIVSIVVPFGGYLIGSYLYIWLNQKRNYNGDYR